MYDRCQLNSVPLPRKDVPCQARRGCQCVKRPTILVKEADHRHSPGKGRSPLKILAVRGYRDHTITAPVDVRQPYRAIGRTRGPEAEVLREHRLNLMQRTEAKAARGNRLPFEVHTTSPTLSMTEHVRAVKSGNPEGDRVNRVDLDQSDAATSVVEVHKTARTAHRRWRRP